MHAAGPYGALRLRGAVDVVRGGYRVPVDRDDVVAAARALAGLSYGKTRDAYVAALYPGVERGNARSQASGQSSCGLTCEAILRACGLAVPPVRSWPPPHGTLPPVVWQREEAKRRGAWVDATVWGIERQLPIAGDMVEIGGDGRGWGDPGVYAGSHVLTLVDGERYDAVSVDGGQPDAANVRAHAGPGPTAIALRVRAFDERPDQLWLVDPATRKGRRVAGWIDVSLM